MPNEGNSLAADNLRAAVAAMYGKVVKQPDGNFPFPVGRVFAESLGYPPELLDSLPRRAVDAFAGISFPLAHAALQAGESVLDLGCGAGMDTIIAARQVGPTGHVHALDLSVAMVERAQENVCAAGLANVTFHQCQAEAVPLPDSSVDVAVVNGIFNLCPDKTAVMAEVHRILRPGGQLLVSEIVVSDGDDAETGETCSLAGTSLDNWFQ